MKDKSSEISSFEVETFIEFLLAGDRQKSFDYIEEYLKDMPDFVRVYEEIIKKALYKIGDLWEHNKISVSSEHLATSIANSLLNHIYQTVPTPNTIGKKIVIGNTENEIHHVGIKMVADVFESYGWETFFYTGDISVNDLIEFIKTKEPNILALSLSLRMNLPTFKKSLAFITAAYPDLPIILGGQAFSKRNNDFLDAFKNVTYIPDLYTLQSFIQNKMNT